jgi:hypothetical protein
MSHRPALVSPPSLSGRDHSARDLALSPLLAERGLDVSYETVRCWVLKFGPGSRPARAEVETVRRIGQAASWDREFADSLLEESGFEPLVPLLNRHNRRTGRMSPTASIRVAY